MVTTLKTRFQNKHDIPANWEKAVNFVPLAGELVIYDDHYFDDNGQKIVVADAIRYKIGDGSMQADGTVKGTKINDLPFVDIIYEEATTSTAGLMSASDKTKLNSLDANILGSAGNNHVYIDHTAGSTDLLGTNHLNLGQSNASGGANISLKDGKATYEAEQHKFNGSVDFSEAEISGLPNGEIDTSNLVTLNGTQTISGQKTFSNAVNLSNSGYSGGKTWNYTVQETFLTDDENNVSAGAFTLKNNGKLYVAPQGSTASELIVAKAGAGNTSYTNGVITRTIYNGTSTSLAIPTTTGTIATQEWVNENVANSNSIEFATDEELATYLGI